MKNYLNQKHIVFLLLSFVFRFLLFFRLPVDIYQTARVVKLLLMMEKGVPIEYKGKTLSEININVDEFVEDDNKSGKKYLKYFVEHILYV